MITLDITKLPQGCNPQCNGCSHRLLSKSDSENQKFSWLKKNLSKWENILQPVFGMEKDQRWGFRGKVKLSAQYNKNCWQFGMWKRQDFVPIHQCPVHKPYINQLIQLFSMVLPPYQDFPLHFLYVADKQVTLILKTRSNPELKWLTNEIQNKIASTGAEALWIHLNPSAGHRLFEKTPWIHLWGNKYSFDYKGLVYGPTSFHQLIPKLYQQSLFEALKFLNPDTGSLVVDLFCGTGHSMKYWEQTGAKIIGIESSGEAVECAIKNNSDAIILRGQCHHRVKQMSTIIKDNNFNELKPLLYVNPPRAGLGAEILSWITGSYKPFKIAYLSCSAGTLQHDLSELCNHGYEVKSIIPFDFFPNTFHIETLTLLVLENQ